jgi:tRNA dimethylallyltransferase
MKRVVDSAAFSDAPLLVIMGPTASGKSALALALAERVGGEIISADSMQVYRGLDIGAAKPTPEERARVPHHLVDVLDIGEPMDANRFMVMADAAIGEIRGRGRVPVVVGGSGLYLKTLLYGMNDLPPSDMALRAQLEGEYAGEDGLRRLRERLGALDPAALAKSLDNPRRLLRALEVCLLTGRAMSDQQGLSGELRYPVRAWRVEWPREELLRRIVKRTDDMLRQGWVAEAATLIRRGLLASPTARQALGYSLIAEHLAGTITAAALRERLIVATRQYARRQSTWFRRQHPEAQVLAMPADPERLAEWGY